MSYPEKYRYAKSHEWLELNGETATIGITDYAQNSLGDIVFVETAEDRAGAGSRVDLRVGGVREGRERSLCAGERLGDGD